MVTKVYGVKYKERPLMAELSDLLDIPHFPTSNGSKVMKDFLKAVCSALGVDGDKIAAANKDGVLALAVAAATGREVSPGIYSPGMTVKNDVLQMIIDGVRWRLDDSPTRGPHPTTFTPDVEEDVIAVRQRIIGLRPVIQRTGQRAFRDRLLTKYGGRCAISGANAEEALDAAHIVPWSDQGSNAIRNGILLRSDLHRLFDLGLIVIDERLHVRVERRISRTVYREFDGARLRLPTTVADRPAGIALRAHRVASGYPGTGFRTLGR